MNKEQSKESKGIFGKEMRLTDWIMASATVAIFITGLMQWSAMKGQLEMGRRDQRAWVGVGDVPSQFKDDANNPLYIKEGEPAKFLVVITNTGKSPAINTKAKIKFMTLPSEEVFTPNYEALQRQSAVVIQPQAIFRLATAPSPQPVTVFDIENIKKGTQILYLFGEITYEDIFRRPHWTTFCMRLSPTLDGFIAHERFNEAN